MKFWTLLAFAAALVAAPVAFAENKPPLIDHSPVKVAPRGQNVLVRATITDDSGPIKEATLFVAVSRDAAPFRVALRDSGAGVFTGTIAADLMGKLDRFQYYIDAVDALALTTETPWYTVEVKSPEAGKTVAADGSAPEPESKRPGWVKPALIAGGVLAVGGVALALSGGGGGGDDDNTSTNGTPNGSTTTNAAGIYSGTQTTCFQPAGGSSSCTSGSITISIDSAGLVSTDTLYPGQHLEGRLSGRDFVLVADVQQDGRTGQIQFVGTQVDTRVVGSIQGSAQTAAGVGTYSGSFSAVKR